MGVWILAGIGVLVALTAAGGYRRLMALRNRVQNAWSQIDAQLRHRHDLISRLVETAKGTMKFEPEVLEEVTRARQQAIEAHGVADQAEAENMLSRTLRSLFVAGEADACVKTNQSMLDLQEELAATGNRITLARQFYNDRVMDLNRQIHQFPWSLIARAGGFRPAEYYIIDEPAPREPPKVAC
jgi:LemA protein